MAPTNQFLKAAGVAAVGMMLPGCAHRPLPLLVMDGRAITMPISQESRGKDVILDLRSISAGNGTLVLRRQPDQKWPKNLVLRVTPGSMNSLDVEGRIRMLIPVRYDKPPAGNTASATGKPPAAGGGDQAGPPPSPPVDLTLMRQLYSDSTSEITIEYRR